MQILIKYFYCDCGYSDDSHCGETEGSFTFPDDIDLSKIEDYWYEKYCPFDSSFISANFAVNNKDNLRR
jgi:hypothetical protein